MNKTLLLILCDFLLLNLLALTRWEAAEPQQAPPQKTSEESKSTAPGETANELVELMRLSLDEEKNARNETNQKLASTAESLAKATTEAQNLAQERERLNTALQTSKENAETVAQRAAQSAREVEDSRLRLAQLQRDLEHKEKEAARERAERASLESQHAAVKAQVENLNVAVRVAEQEKILLRENLASAKSEVVTVREEKEKIQQQAGLLAEGVGKLAEKSGELTREIRENRPLSANTLFSEFLANQVALSFTAKRDGVFGELTIEKQSRTVLISDGQKIYALVHAAETPVNPSDIPVEYHALKGTMRRPPAELKIPSLGFHASEPRIVLIPVDAAQATSLGVKVYPLVADPFKFPEVVLVSSSGKYYGETEFKLDPETPSYVKMNTRILTRLFGEFSPSAGDLVFSKNGDLLGIMVTSSYCHVLLELKSETQIASGENSAGMGVRATWTSLKGRLTNLPLRLQ